MSVFTRARHFLQAGLFCQERVLIVQPLEGLANRLRVLASAKLMAEHTGRNLLVSWTRQPIRCNARWTDLFVNPVAEYPYRVLKYQEKLQSDKVRILMPFQQPEILTELEHILQSDIPVIAVSHFGLFKPQWVSQAEFQDIRSKFYRALKPISKIEQTVKSVVDGQFANCEVIGVHIRRTDLRPDLGDVPPQQVSPTSLFIEEMEKRLAGQPKVRFFLATDDFSEEKTLIKHFGDKLILYHKNTINRNTRQGIQDGLIDWLLLSRTSLIIRSHYSSFSEESALVNQIPVITIRAEQPTAN
jgi:hypothetical protein